MPYLRKEDRHPNNYSVGALTYNVQQALMLHLEEKMMDNGTVSYADLAECLGALEGAKADFIDRILLPYERRKRADNGDVWHHVLLGHVEVGS